MKLIASTSFYCKSCVFCPCIANLTFKTYGYFVKYLLAVRLSRIRSLILYNFSVLFPGIIYPNLRIAKANAVYRIFRQARKYVVYGLYLKGSIAERRKPDVILMKNYVSDRSPQESANVAKLCDPLGIIMSLSKYGRYRL